MHKKLAGTDGREGEREREERDGEVRGGVREEKEEEEG